MNIKNALLSISLVLSLALTASSQIRVYEDGKLPADSRLGELRHLNNYFPFDVPEDIDSWKQRQAQLRKRLLVANGLWPLPERTPLNAKVFGKTEREGFTVEKVYFESYPGHFVSGLLFRPTESNGKHPAVLSPHGHGGRLQDHGDGIKGLIENGDEVYEASGRFPKLARCAQLARMGCVTFIYDMEGYVDSLQLPMEVSHRLNNARPDLESPEQWGFFSAQAEMRLQSIMGVQTWNSIRALDFLTSLPDVDAKRIGITGGSGGGTQTIVLGAIDDRPVVSFPQGMVSTDMQGGCPCENCNLLRVDTGNVELAGLFAPRPIAMTGANDWTSEIQTKGYPELQKLYGLYDKPEDVFCVSYLQFGHNYNYVTRRVMYHWFNKHLGLRHKEPIVEKDYQLLTDEQVHVWDDEHPAPEAGVAHEVKLLKAIDDASKKQLEKLIADAEDPAATFKKIHGEAIKSIIIHGLPKSDDLEREKVKKVARDGYIEFGDILRNKVTGAELPLVSLFPTEQEWNKTVTIWLSGEGNAGLYDAEGKLNATIQKLLSTGSSIISADLLYQGEFLKEGKSVESQRLATTTNRAVSAYTFCYNHTLFSHRVHDALSLISFVANDEHEPNAILLIGAAGAGPVAATARAIAGSVIDIAFIDTKGFRFADITKYSHPEFFPGAIKYGDLPGILALNAPHPLVITGESKLPALVKQIYGEGGKVILTPTFDSAFSTN